MAFDEGDKGERVFAVWMCVAVGAMVLMGTVFVYHCATRGAHGVNAVPVDGEPMVSTTSPPDCELQSWSNGAIRKAAGSSRCLDDLWRWYKTTSDEPTP